MRVTKMLTFAAAVSVLTLISLKAHAIGWNPLKELKNAGTELVNGVKEEGKKALNEAKQNGKQTLERSTKQNNSNSNESGKSNVGRTVGNQTTKSTTSGTSYQSHDDYVNERKWNPSAKPNDEIDVPRKYPTLPVANVHSEYGYVCNPFANPEITSRTVHLVLDYNHNPLFSDFHDGVAYISDDVKAFYIDKQGNVLFDTDLRESDRDKMPRFSNGVVVERPNLYTDFKNARLRNKQGTVIKELNTQLCSHMVDGVAAVFVSKGDRGILSDTELRYIDTKGNYIFSNLTSVYPRGTLNDLDRLIRNSSEGLTAFAQYDKTTSSEKWGFRDSNGNIVVQPKYAMVSDFKDGAAAVLFKSGKYDSGKWGYIDKTGREIIPPTYTIVPSDFDNGLARVLTKNGEAYIIDKKGNKVKGPFSLYNQEEGQLTYISPFHDGYAIMGVATEFGDDDMSYTHTAYYAVDTNFNYKSWTDQRSLDLNWDTLMGSEDGILYIKVPLGYHYLCLNPANLNMKTAAVTSPFSDGLSRYDVRQQSVPQGYINDKNEYVIILEKNEF